MTSVGLFVEREPALTIGVAIGAVGAVQALRRGAPLSIAATPLLAAVATGAVIRAAVSPVRSVRDPELLRPPWLHHHMPSPGDPEDTVAEHAGNGMADMSAEAERPHVEL